LRTTACCLNPYKTRIKLRLESHATAAALNYLHCFATTSAASFTPD
jgi:hypothetical protein